MSKPDREKFTDAVVNHTISSLFPTKITTVTGNLLTIKAVACSSYYNNTLTHLGFKSHFKNSTVVALAYNLYGEFLRKIMIPSESLIQYMHYLYPNYDKEEYNSVHLRFGGDLADIPVFIEFMSMDSLSLII
mgnify:CR=1 FL=1